MSIANQGVKPIARERRTLKGEDPREALCGGITVSFLEPLCRSWSHFVGIYRQKLTRSVGN